MRKLTTDEIGSQRKQGSDILDVHRIPVVAILEDVRSLYNVGSIFRTADAALIRKLILTGYTPTPPRKEIEKTALGATKTVPWVAEQSAQDSIRLLRSDGYRICAVESTSRSKNLYSTPAPAQPIVVVFGNEISGIKQSTLDLCDEAWEIPMFGTKHSLNVSVAFGIVAYELGRRLRKL